MYPIVRLAGVSLAALATVLVTAVAVPVPATAATESSTVTESSTITESATGTVAASSANTTVHSITDRLARQVATSLSAPAQRDRIVSGVVNGPVDLATIGAGSALVGSVRSANGAVLAAKGLPASEVSLLRLRLAQPDLRAALLHGEAPLVAATPTDDRVTSVTAYDLTGATIVLDAARPPGRPVLLVEVDTARAVPLGLEVLHDALAGYGITGAEPAFTVAAGYWATKVTAIRLNDDKEPWIKGAAEIFNVVGGFGLDGKVKIDTVQMPYLDHDKTTYYPNQLIVHFSAYKYNLADVVMMEDDGDTNYLALAQAIATALLTIVDQGVYIPLVNAILSAMPSSWWTDDPDYVDSWYTLATQSSGRLYGAAANGWMDVVPYWVSEL